MSQMLLLCLVLLVSGQACTGTKTTDSDGNDAGSDETGGSSGDGGLARGKGTPGTGGRFMIDPDSLRAHTTPELPWIGAAINTEALVLEEAYRASASREFNSVTPEVAMKWGSIHPEPTRWSFDAADAVVGFAEANMMAVRGHALLWHEQLPAWVNDSLSAEALKAALDDHIHTLVGRYKGRVKVWDVVNEAMDDQAHLRTSIFARKLGRGYIADAFRLARAADPDAILAYNDYGIERPGAKTDAVLSLLGELKRAGVPVQAVGLQYHVNAYEFATRTLNAENLRATIRRYAELGLEVHITALDVRVASLEGNPASRLAFQEGVYRTITAVCRSEPACTSLTTWGFTDKHSWIDDRYGADDPLLLDEAMARKPAYNGVRDGLDGEEPGSLDAGFATDCGKYPEALVCEPFESAGIPPTFYSAATNGSIQVEPGNVHLGAKALRSRTQQASDAGSLAGFGGLGQRRTGALHARAYIYLPSTIVSGPDSTLLVMGLSEAAPPYGGVGVAMQNGKVFLNAPSGPRYVVSTTLFPRNRWTCVTLTVNIAEVGGSATIGIDGANVISSTNFDTLPASGYSNINVGSIYKSVNHSATDVLVDELVVDTKPVACD